MGDNKNSWQSSISANCQKYWNTKTKTVSNYFFKTWALFGLKLTYAEKKGLVK